MTHRRPINNQPSSVQPCSDKENQLPMQLTPYQKMRNRPSPFLPSSNTVGFSVLRPSKHNYEINLSTSNLPAIPANFSLSKQDQSHQQPGNVDRTSKPILASQNSIDRSFVRYPKPSNENIKPSTSGLISISKGSSTATTTRQHYGLSTNRQRIQKQMNYDAPTEINDLKQLQSFLLASDLEEQADNAIQSNQNADTFNRFPDSDTRIDSSTSDSEDHSLISFKDDHLISKLSATTSSTAPPRISMSRILNRSNPSKLRMRITDDTELYSCLTTEASIVPVSSTNSASSAATRKTSTSEESSFSSAVLAVLSQSTTSDPFFTNQNQQQQQLQYYDQQKRYQQDVERCKAEQIPERNLLTVKNQQKEDIFMRTLQKIRKHKKSYQNNKENNTSQTIQVAESKHHPGTLLATESLQHEIPRNKSRTKSYTNGITCARAGNTAASTTIITNGPTASSKSRTLQELLEKQKTRVPLEMTKSVTQQHTERHHFNKRVQDALAQFKELQKQSLGNQNNCAILDPQFNSHAPSLRNHSSTLLISNSTQKFSREKLLFDIIESKNLPARVSQDVRTLPLLKILPPTHNSQAPSQFNTRSGRSLTFQSSNSIHSVGL